MITFIIYLLILAVILILALWIIDQIPLPEPLNRIVKIVIVVLGALFVIMLLLQLVGGGGDLHLPKIGQ